MQKSARCSFMYGEMTDKQTTTRIEQALENHAIEQYEILLYKKTSKSSLSFTFFISMCVVVSYALAQLNAPYILPSCHIAS